MFKRLITFIKETKSELFEKTTWPTKDAVLSSTIVVIVSMGFVSICLFLADLAIGRFVRFSIVENIRLIRPYFSFTTFLLFAVGFLMLSFLVRKIGKRMRG